ncbi:hypothetical protein Bca52824_064848 [Brassica carinata]|uniref:Uncharacterized protein ycf68 n=2 Tax=Magnoliopsida TaxID=3398 RepID=A0A8X7QIC2_BRACI|nr:hypothetical protein Bca52824_064848 [Brassica carinata]
MDSSMFSSAHDPEMWIIQGTLAYASPVRTGFETKLLLRRIDGAIQVRSNVDPTFYSLGSGGPRGPPRLLSSRESIHPLSVYVQLSRKQLFHKYFLWYGRGEQAHLRAQYNGELCDDLLHGRGLWFKSRMAQLCQGKEYKKDLTPSCMLHLARGDIAQLVELRSGNWVVAITGWVSNCPGGPSPSFYADPGPGLAFWEARSHRAHGPAGLPAVVGIIPFPGQRLGWMRDLLHEERYGRR